MELYEIVNVLTWLWASTERSNPGSKPPDYEEILYLPSCQSEILFAIFFQYFFFPRCQNADLHSRAQEVSFWKKNFGKLQIWGKKYFYWSDLTALYLFTKSWHFCVKDFVSTGQKRFKTIRNIERKAKFQNVENFVFSKSFRTVAEDEKPHNTYNALTSKKCMNFI